MKKNESAVKMPEGWEHVPALQAQLILCLTFVSLFLHSFLSRQAHRIAAVHHVCVFDKLA